MSQLPYYPYSHHLREAFGGKAYKLVVSGGFTCPNRDGKLGFGGCAFCDERGSVSHFGGRAGVAVSGSIPAQIDAQIGGVRARFGAEVFLAYFQSYSNTYAPVEHLRPLYEAALAHPAIRGLCIGTRPDCLGDEVLVLLEELAQKHYVCLELGIQSFEDPVLAWLERGHDRATVIDALQRLRQLAPHVHVCVHLIFGTPVESADAPAAAARILAEHGVRGAKLHQLMILQGTRLAERWEREHFPVLELDEYCERVIQFLEWLPPTIYLERLHATATDPDSCLAPEWSRKRWLPHNRLRDLFAERGVRQGARV